MPELEIETAADLQTTLNALLQEHVYLLAATTDATIDVRQTEMLSAQAALDENSMELAAVIALAYGDEAGTAFLDIWEPHIGDFVTYAQASATANQQAKQDALDSLDQYTQEFGEFIANANPGLEADAVTQLTAGHVETSAAFIDAQAQQSEDVFMMIREAAQHMKGLADPLAAAIAEQFPDLFPMESAGGTGGSPTPGTGTPGAG